MNVRSPFVVAGVPVLPFKASTRNDPSLPFVRWENSCRPKQRYVIEVQLFFQGTSYSRRGRIRRVVDEEGGQGAVRDVEEGEN